MQTFNVSDFLTRLHRDERGSGNSAIWLAMLALPLIVVAGLGFDMAGQVQARDEAYQVASAASRAGTAALGGNIYSPQDYGFAPGRAATAAQQYLAASGIDGTVSVRNGEITVTAENSYRTMFVSLIGINTIPASATATARLITEETTP